MSYELYFYPDIDDAQGLYLSTRGESATGGWFCNSVTIEPPKARTRYVTIPGRSGVLDYSESLGLSFDNRKVTFSLSFPVAGDNIQIRKKELYSVHGKVARVTTPSTQQDRRIFPAATGEGRWAFVGRCLVTSCVQNKATIDAVITMDAFPVFRSINRTTKEITIANTRSDAGSCVHSYQFPRISIAQYPPFEVSGAAVILYPTADDALANTNGVQLEVGTYDSHPYVWLNPEETTYQYVYACRASTSGSNATMTIKPYVYGGF